MTDDSILGASEGAFDLTQASSVGEVDAWIESLMSCKQLSEVDVKKLCDKVCTLLGSHDPQRKSSSISLTLLGARDFTG